MVGFFNDISGDHGFVITDGQFTRIDVPRSKGSGAIGINDKGDIVVPYEWDRAHPGNDYAGTAAAGAVNAGMTTSSRSFRAVASTVRPAVVR